MSAPNGTPTRSLTGRAIDWLERRLALGELFSFVTHFGLIWTKLDPNKPVRELARETADTPIEPYAMWPRALGLLLALLFLLEVVTGTLLAFYYQPASEVAHESTRTIVRDIPFGWLLHQLHAWGAWLLVVTAMVRLARLFWDGLYRAPREVLWFSAVALVILAVKLELTGRLLTWDVNSYWSVMRGLDVLATLPLIGPLIQFVAGGRVVNDTVLIRFYVLHVVILPFWFAAFVYLTFATLRRVGLSPVEGGARASTTVRDHAFTLASLLLVVFAALVTFAVLLPFPFRAVADPYATPGGVRPPWYLLAPYALMQALPLPAWLPGLGIVLAVLALPFLPVWLSRTVPGISDKRLRIGGLALLGLWVLLSVFGTVMEGRK